MESKGTSAGRTCTRRDVSARWWRQVGFWGLTVNAVLGFPILLLALWFKPETDWGIMTAIYPTILAAWCAAAGIRQWGKNQGAEAPTPMVPPVPEGVVDTGPLD